MTALIILLILATLAIVIWRCESIIARWFPAWAKRIDTDRESRLLVDTLGTIIVLYERGETLSREDIRGLIDRHLPRLISRGLPKESDSLRHSRIEDITAAVWERNYDNPYTHPETAPAALSSR